MQAPDFLIHLPLGRAEAGPGSRELEGSGGCLVLAMLARALTARGFSAELLPFDDLDRRAALAPALAAGRTIAVYPEGVPGNPLAARRVVRWVLYRVERARLQAWRAAGEMVVAFFPQFLPAGEAAPHLRLLDAGLGFFADLGQPRAGVGVHVGKGRVGDSTPPLPAGAEIEARLARLGPAAAPLVAALGPRPRAVERVPDRTTRAEQRALFNRLGLFVSHDNDTALASLAALCGCPTLVIPDPRVPAAARLPALEVGVAWSWEGLPAAWVRLAEVPAHLARLEAEAEATLDPFLTLVCATFGPLPGGAA